MLVVIITVVIIVWVLGSKLETIKSYRDANLHCPTELLRCFQMLSLSINHAKGRFHFIFWKSNLRLREVRRLA